MTKFKYKYRISIIEDYKTQYANQNYNIENIHM